MDIKRFTCMLQKQSFNLRCRLIAGSMMMLLVVSAHASDTRLGRYLKVEGGITREQAMPLEVNVEIDYPQSVQTVSEAINYTLLDSGYTLMIGEKNEQVGQKPYELKLPGVHRHLGPAPLVGILNALAGPGYKMVIDHSNRELTFVKAEIFMGGREHV